jgi:DNA-binding NarL/FixJ family response regulator
MPNKPRVLLADDHESVLSGARALLELEFDVVGAVADGEALVRAAEELKPDVMVVDVEMPVLNGIEAARRLKSIHPEGKIVFMSIYGTPAIIQEALSTGALGYVLKVSADDDLVEAVREALQGRSFISPTL